jgi:hypothetical protein
MLRFSRRLAAVLAMVAVIAAAAAAQTPPTPPTTPAAPPTAAAASQPMSVADSAATLIDPRTVELIQKDIEDMAGQKLQAEQTMDRKRQLQIRADTEIKVKETQIQSLGAQIDLASKEKDALKKSDLESQKKLAELEKQLLQRRKLLRDREIDYWTATRDYADMRRKSFESELALAQLREQRDGMIGSASSPAVYAQLQALETKLRDAERRTLEAQIAAATKRQAIAQQEAEVLKAKKEIFDAQIKLKMGG